MNDEDARQRVKDDMATAIDLFGGPEADPEVTRKMVDNVVDRYLAYRTGDIEETETE